MFPLWWNLLIFSLSVEAFVPLEGRSRLSRSQKGNRICPAAACDFRLWPVRVPGSLRIQPRCYSYAAACRCGNRRCWLLRDKGLDSFPLLNTSQKGKNMRLKMKNILRNIHVGMCNTCKKDIFLKPYTPAFCFFSPSAVTQSLLNHYYHGSDPGQWGRGRNLHN